jgi:hypothetical protein
MKFTVESIKKLKLEPEENDRTWSDDTISGWLFRMRRTRKGANCYWLFDYPVGDAVDTGSRKRRKRRKLMYGRYPAMLVPPARAKAEQLHAETVLGVDPQQMKAENRRRAVDTYEAWVKLYLPWLREKNLAPVTLGENERHLTRNLAGLNPLRIDQIDQLRLAAEIKAFVAATGAKVQGNRTGTSVFGFFEFCRGEARSPSIRRQDSTGIPKQRVTGFSRWPRLHRC